jgi:hypothetical protein
MPMAWQIKAEQDLTAVTTLCELATHLNSKRKIQICCPGYMKRAEINKGKMFSCVWA